MSKELDVFRDDFLAIMDQPKNNENLIKLSKLKDKLKVWARKLVGDNYESGYGALIAEITTAETMYNW